MRLSEASQVLGVSPDADKQAIEKAARQQIRKWHPDRWRNASEAEQKKAEEEYSKVSKAQQTLLHPDTADPEPRDIPSPSYQSQVNVPPTSFTPSSGRQSQSASGGYATGHGQGTYDTRFQGRNRPSSTDDPFADAYTRPEPQRPKYNTATSFEDMFGMAPDPMEQTLNRMHNEESESQYGQIADVMRASMSVVASLAMFLASLLMLLGTMNIVNVSGMAAEGTIGGAISSILPPTGHHPSIVTFALLCLLSVIKLLVYDTLIAPLIADRVRLLTPGMICGIDMMICGAIGYALSALWPVPRLVYGMIVFLGALLVIAAHLVRLVRAAA